MRKPVHAAAVLLAAIWLPMRAAAQQPRLSPTLTASVDRLADSARALGLPTDPLYAKAAEGTLKGADEARIMDAVRRLARELGDARTALGAGTTPPELVAGASALHAGVAPGLLHRLAAAQGGRGASGRLVMPLVVLADMVARHVTPDVAISSLEPLVERGAPDADLSTLRSSVERDIAGGQAPDQAMRARSAAVLRAMRTPDEQLDATPR